MKNIHHDDIRQYTDRLGRVVSRLDEIYKEREHTPDMQDEMSAVFKVIEQLEHATEAYDTEQEAIREREELAAMDRESEGQNGNEGVTCG